MKRISPEVKLWILSLAIVVGAVACSWLRSAEVDGPSGTAVKLKGSDREWVPNPAPTYYVFVGCPDVVDGGVIAPEQ